MKRQNVLVVVFLLTIFSGCTAENKQEIVISAASSLQNALREIEINYENQHQNIDLQFNFGASGTLLTQINQGASPNIYISASKTNYNSLNEQGKIYDGVDLLKNNLVLIGNKNNKIGNINDINKIAIGTPDAVPAGTYTKQTLENLNMWNKVQDKLVYAKDVEEVLTYVDTQNVDVGFVYTTDAISSNNVEVIKVIDENLHDPIIYPMALLTNDKASQDFFNYLQTNEALTVFEKYGFIKNDE